MKPTQPSTILSVLTALASLVLTSILMREALSRASDRGGRDSLNSVARRTPPPGHYSWDGEDFPPLLPIPPSPKWLTQIEESVHYSIVNPESEKEWLYNTPLSTGGINLGPKNRAFAVSIFHQLHCLRGIRTILANPQDRTGGYGHGHIEHCLTMLRQLTLCKADLTLEPGDFTKTDFSRVRTGSTHVCNRDLEAIYDVVGATWLQWNRLMKYTNISIT
ncbi:hypothetical protein BDN72DRAFT_794481, partial [Pluteus cervinus]